MSSILNLFSNSNDLMKKKHVANSASEYKIKKIDVFTPTPSLSQGDKFKNYQKKIKNKIEKNINNPNSKEGFAASNSNVSLTKETKNVLSETNISSQEQNISSLQQEYQNTLGEYESLLATLTGSTNGYLSRVNSNNPYLGKNISIGPQTMYVTQQGVAKWYPTADVLINTAGKNGCPASTQIIATNLKWSTNYETPGATIPTTPALISGTPMVLGQSCGREGQNIYVNNMINPTIPINPTYEGCYKDVPPGGMFKMNYIGGSPSPTANGTYNINQCQQSAIDGGFRYFALQNVNPSNSLGFCTATNNLYVAQQPGISYVPTGMVPLWASNTSGQTGNTAILQNTGSLAVLSSSGSNVFITPNSNAQPGNYYGCYGDGPNRAMSIFSNGPQMFDNAQCQYIAKQFGFDYYGLQNSTSGTNAQCTLSNSLSQSMEYGIAGNCTKIGDGSWSGGGWSNAVYNTNTPSVNYYLILLDTGDMCINRGRAPSDDQGNIWCSSTAGLIQSPNPAYAAANGKYGTNWMPVGSTLAAGDFIGSTNGQMALIMQSDGNLILYTFQNKINCGLINGTTMNGGGVGANALYDIGLAGIKPNMGQLAFIDQNSELHSYPSDNKQTTNTYTPFMNTDNIGNDILNTSTGNSTIPQCRDMCNSNSDCYGFTFDSRNGSNICNLKNSGAYPVGEKQLIPGVNLFVRNVQPINPPVGVTSNTNTSDTITFNNYVNGGKIGNEYGLANATSVQKQQLQQMQIRLNLISNQISQQTGSFKNDDNMVNNQGVKNMIGLGTYLTEIDNANNKIKGINTNTANIVNDSDIVVLQKNYNYLFWSILAAGTVLVSMNVIKK